MSTGSKINSRTNITPEQRRAMFARLKASRPTKLDAYGNVDIIFDDPWLTRH